MKYTDEFLKGGTELLRKVSLDIPEGSWGAFGGLQSQPNVLYVPDPEPESDEEPAWPPNDFRRQALDASPRLGLRHLVWDPIPIATDINLRGPKDTTSHAGTKWTLTPIKAGDGGGKKAYFLPWDSQGGACEMTLPEDGEVPLFFTAGLSGCSVIVTGPKDSPTVYHCGIASWDSSGMAVKPEPPDIPGFWRELVAYLATENVTHAKPTEHSISRTLNQPIIGEANKLHYGKDPNVTHQHPTDKDDEPGHTSEGAKKCMTDILQDYCTKAPPKNNRVKGGEAAPWGSFFGIRDMTNGEWAFYLQENLRLTHDGWFATGTFSGVRRLYNWAKDPSFEQSLPWRLRGVVRPDGGEGGALSARTWKWDDVKDGNFWVKSE